MIDSRVEFLFQLVLALPSGPTQQRALAAALKVADAKSRLHALQEACTHLNGHGYDIVDRLTVAASVAVREAVAAAHGALGQEGGQA